MSDWGWVIASYGLTWLVLGAYAVWTLRRLGDARERVEAEWKRSNREVER